MRRPHLAWILVLGVSVGFLAGVAQATEEGGSLFIPGWHGPDQGSSRRPGSTSAMTSTRIPVSSAADATRLGGQSASEPARPVTAKY
ncbi:hypothetical protein [Microvirga soli]|uniref:hypothetical protein n=1 Tax=Microvirga soli TaxID=1854496 RepID=UPI00191FC96E|nr:hypothetical protein [Microvirga soli]